MVENLTMLVIYSLIACCTIMFIVWLWAVKLKNAGVVDIFWSYNFPVIALIVFAYAEGFETRVMLICGMVILWGLRLGSHLALRVLGHIDEEEGRYKQLREDWAPNPDKRFFGFFQMQALSNVLLAVPFFIISVNPEPEISALEFAGLALWLLALCGEAIADEQLARFKKDQNNKGKICNVGLWHYSRHPNYFFEWLIWVGYFIFALSSPYGYLAIISPAIILYLLLRVTGIPLNEEQAVRSKGDLYREYQRTTSVFVPWLPKKL
jgi:steroid 5-alpha reductase family enzyme